MNQPQPVTFNHIGLIFGLPIWGQFLYDFITPRIEAVIRTSSTGCLQSTPTLEIVGELTNEILEPFWIEIFEVQRA